MGEAARRRRAQIEAGAQAIHSEGQGVMELGVYMIADLVALRRSLTRARPRPSATAV